MTGILLKAVEQKFKESQMPNLDDKITNPMSEFKTVAEKRAAYDAARGRAKAFFLDHREIKYIVLGYRGAEFNNVEFIAGAWRIQNKFDYQIINVRGKDFVLGDKLPHQERTKFDFYRAYSVGNNCYGKYIFPSTDYIVAKYATPRGTYWAYGQTIEQARAFLGIKLYDEHQDLIHANLSRPQEQK